MDRPPTAEEILARVSAAGSFALFCIRVHEDGRLEHTWGSSSITEPEDWLARIYADDSPAARAALDRLVAGSEHEMLELRVVFGDELRWVQTRMFRMRSADGAPVHLCGTMVDITDLKIAQDKAYGASRQYRALFHDNPVPIATWRVRGDEIFLENYNDAAAKFTHGLANLLGREVGDIYPPDAEQLIALRRCAREGLKFTTTIHVTLVTSGASKDVIATFVPIPPDLVMVHAEDVTERELSREALVASEARFRALVQHAPDAVSLVDAKGSFLYESPRSLAFFGPSRSPRNAFDFIHPDDLALARKTMALVLAAPQGGGEQLELRARRADGLWRCVSVKATNHIDEPGIAGVVVNFQDITDSRELEQKLAQSQKMEAMGQLAGGVAHDFNNLLAVILNFTSFVVDELPEGDPKRNDLMEVVRATEHGVRLTKQLLSFGRKEVHRPRVLDLVASVRALEELLHRTLGEHIAIVVTLPSTPMHVEIDETRFEQILLNLAVNARDAMPQGGRLHVALARGTGVDADRVVLTVSDEGVGIPDEIRRRIFEPFFTTKDIGLGTGLGLATVYAAVETAGGTIEVESAVGAGTTFRISLPHAQSVAAPLRPPPSAPVSSATGAKERVVLVVEDDAAVQRTVVRVLEREGFVVRPASNATEALALMADDGDAVSCVLSDVVMPGMSGPALIAELHVTRPDLPAILMSGHIADVLEAQGALSKGIALLDKPFTRDEIVSKLESVLARARPAAP
jgi:PAS domain S-box-containing protein